LRALQGMRMSTNDLADPRSACKRLQPGRTVGSERTPGALERLATLAGGGPIAEPNFFISDSHLRWREARHFKWATRHA
jgi:hypothetical protein